MLDGSATISTSTPALAMAARVFATRALCSASVKAGLVSDIHPLRCKSAGKYLAGPGRGGALAGERCDRGVLHAGAGQVGHGDLFGTAAPWRLAADDRPELGEVGIGSNYTRRDGVMQFAEPARLRQPVGHIAAEPRKHRRIDLVLVLGVRAHGGQVLARREPAGLEDGGRRRRGGDDDVGAGNCLARIA